MSRTVSTVLAIAALFIMAALTMASVPPNVSYRLVSWDSFLFEGALQNPPPPIPTAGANSGGSCSSSYTYQFYRSDANLSGETALSTVSARFTPAAGSSNIITLSFGSFPNNASAVHFWFSRSDDEYSTIYACGAAGAISDVTSGIAASCLCSTTATATHPTSNTTANVYSVYPVSGPSGTYVQFPAGLRFSSSSTTAPSSDVFLKKDADTGCLQEWKDGTLGWQLCSNRVIMPDCSSGTPTLEFGGFCKDQTSGRVIMNTGTGTVYVSGDSL